MSVNGSMKPSRSENDRYPFPALYEEIVPGGGHISLILRRGHLLRLTDIDGGANVSAMMLNADQFSERLNIPDTLKAQHTSRLTRGHCLYSDMGRVLAAIVGDTCGWHDSLGGVLDAAEVRNKYGEGRYQELRNGFFRNGQENLLMEMAKWGLGLQDLMMVVNFFSRIDVNGDGAFSFVPDNSRAGDSVELYAPMNVLMVFTAVQHPMDPAPTYAPRPIHFSVHDVADNDMAAVCRNSCPENERGFLNTERYYL